MVTSTDFYLLKLQFKAEDAMSGEMKKQKREFIAECVSYAEAETLAYKIMENENWMKHEYSKPEIVRIAVSDLRTNDCIIVEKNAFDGFHEMYLENENDHFYKVDVSDPYEDENGKTKYQKTSLFIPAATTGKAESYAMKLFPNAFVSAAKIMGFLSAFVTPSTFEIIEKNYQDL